MPPVSGLLESGTGTALIYCRVLSKPEQFILDLLVLAATFLFSSQLRFGFAILNKALIHTLKRPQFVHLAKFAILYIAAICKFVWRYCVRAEARKIVKAALCTTLPNSLFTTAIALN
jgi:hypothetical protein